MQVHVSPGSGVPIYLQIVQQVKYLIASGALQPGEEIPAIRQLAKQLLVNPNTVARAYRELEREGVLTLRRGSGTFVSSGGSPLKQSEKTRILSERIDALLSEAQQLGVNTDALFRLIEKRDAKMRKNDARIS